MIEVETQEEVEECLRRKKYDRVVNTFVSEEEAKKYSSVTIKSEGWTLLYTYMGMRVARIRAGRIPTEIKAKWLVVVIRECTKYYDYHTQVTCTQNINW